jgi:hypothetical protein
MRALTLFSVAMGFIAFDVSAEAQQLRPLSERYLAWVARGSAAAVASARREMARLDAGDAEALGDALGRAMQVAPSRVLPLVNSAPGLSADWICTPFIGEDVSIERASAILRRSRKAIERVNDPRLASARAACLREIRESQFSLAHHG